MFSLVIACRLSLSLSLSLSFAFVSSSFAILGRSEALFIVAIGVVVHVGFAAAVVVVAPPIVAVFAFPTGDVVSWEQKPPVAFGLLIAA